MIYEIENVLRFLIQNNRCLKRKLLILDEHLTDRILK